MATLCVWPGFHTEGEGGGGYTGISPPEFYQL